MIKYRLICAEGHEFEAWFASSDSYEVQAQACQIICPRCGGHDVTKAIMAPAVSARMRESETAVQAPAPHDGEPRFMDLLREFRRSILANSEDVGASFPEEARKIHYGDADARNIRGTATGEEAEALSEEGIDIIPVPPLPEDTN